MNTIKRITVICFAVLILAANMPLCVFATDPVSAATMANALAQAITAYGASQGVSMTFDVTSTDGIGEGVHELWNNFKEDIQDDNVPTYDSLAITMWADIYTKIGNNVGININDTEMPYIDAFWNWLLSGPAEMTKVDNQYYEWTVNQNTGNVDPILLINDVSYLIGGYQWYNLPLNYTGTYAIYNYNHSYTLDSGTTYYLTYINENSVPYIAFFSLNDNNNVRIYTTENNNVVDNYLLYFTSYDNGAFYFGASNPKYDSRETLSGFDITAPSFDPNAFVSSVRQDSSIVHDESSVSIKPYIGDTSPQDVYIPDNDDVNYTPLPYIGGLDIPWDDTLFGDGTGTLTDAQSEAISGIIDDAITDSLEKTLILAETENPDIPAPGEVYVPFLPVTLPNFNFNLSGIWHYVREWIASLSAWFATVLSIWSSLPYALVVPVYASLVIVIVLGVYKRFFM